jgi:hypothetical protein
MSDYEQETGVFGQCLWGGSKAAPSYIPVHYIDRLFAMMTNVIAVLSSA